MSQRERTISGLHNNVQPESVAMDFTELCVICLTKRKLSGGKGGENRNVLMFKEGAQEGAYFAFPLTSVISLVV